MLKKILFRLIRNSLVLHLRAEGLSWAVINRVLRATGQKIVARAEPAGNGVIIHYEDYDPVKGLSQKGRA
ncbi:MAG: hypothetical protein JST88_09280 [Bacteroidetes bacterium]|nr:hypothetical protein [Bacteroidota bacterium]